MPVVITGDFNCDITKGAKAAVYLIDDYELRVSSIKSRGKKRGPIDFIAVRYLVPLLHIR